MYQEGVVILIQPEKQKFLRTYLFVTLPILNKFLCVFV